MGWRSGMRRKKIAPEAKVQVSFTPRERELVLEYTLAGPDVTGSIAAASEKRGKFSVPYTLDDLDELLGYIAAEANHCKAEYQGQQATFTFDGEPLAGTLRSGTAPRLIREWALAHRVELDANWNRVKGGQPLERIAPLD
jgi:hypothetical protein